jgi:hypothetical protein
MTFDAKMLAPLPCDPDAANDVFKDAASGGVTLIYAPDGYLLTEGLALALTDMGRRPLWLRVGPEDRDPAAFLLSVVAAARRSYPGAGADIAAVSVDAVTAQRWFDVAASQYERRGDIAGECRSILSGSAVAAEAGDFADASSRASAARSLASAADLADVQMWATWQLGRVALAAGDADGALVSFCGAASSRAAADALGARPVRDTGDLAMHVMELRRQQESHREAQAALSRAEHETLNQLMSAATAAGARSDEVSGADGWRGTPVPLKFPMLAGPELARSGPARREERPRPLSRWRRALLPHRDTPPSEAPPPRCRTARLTRPPPGPGPAPPTRLPSAPPSFPSRAGRAAPASSRCTCSGRSTSRSTTWRCRNGRARAVARCLATC